MSTLSSLRPSEDNLGLLKKFCLSGSLIILSRQFEELLWHNKSKKVLN